MLPGLVQRYLIRRIAAGRQPNVDVRAASARLVHRRHARDRHTVTRLRRLDALTSRGGAGAHGARTR